MNDNLQKGFTNAEIKLALNQMAPLKSLELYGFEAYFFQSYWSLVGDEVSKLTLDLLNGGQLNKAINSTYIVLIPKIKNPMEVRDYRPISLCNVLYKIIAKTHANRLKKVLPEVISSN